MQPVTIAFNTANLVAHFSNYKFELKNWGQQHKLTSDSIDGPSFSEICRKIRAAGYDQIELWVALVEKCDAASRPSCSARRLMT